MNRIDRLSAILIMLQSSPSIKPKDITKRFGISIRTVYRDIRALEEVGIPISGDSICGYSLVDGFKLPPLMFTQEEAFAFLAAERLMDKFADQGLRISHKSGVEKIRAVMRLAEKETMSTIEDKIGNLNFQSMTQQSPLNCTQQLLDSISKHEKIEIDYIAYRNDKQTKRIVDPIGIFFSLANWYLIAFCNTKNEYRTFKISRIQQMKQTGLQMNKKHPSLESFLEKLKSTTALHKVIIEVSRNNYPTIDESKYYQGLVSEVKNEEKVELHFMTFSLERLGRWYLSYMDIAKITYPKELDLITKDIIYKYKSL